MNCKTKIKILICTPTLQCGGSEKFVWQLCENINSDNFSVLLIVVNNSNPFYVIQNTAIEIIDLKKKRVLFSVGAIKRIVQSFQPDVLFSTANHLNLYLAVFRLRFSTKIKFIARESSIVSINTSRTKFPYLYNLLIKKYYRRFDFIVCQSVYMQHDLVSRYAIDFAKTCVITNALEYGFNSTTLPVKSVKEDKQYKFITVARLSPEKGIKRMIHSVGLLSIPFQYYIVGEGTERIELEKLIDELQLQDKVFLLGEKPAPYEGLEDADLFLMGSYYEGFPNVLLEAGALGMPIIAFDVPGGIKEIIKDGENGFLVEDNDIIGFAATIKRGLAENFNRALIGNIAQQQFSVSKMIYMMEKLFFEIV